jgi:hypothetical protein
MMPLLRIADHFTVRPTEINHTVKIHQHEKPRGYQNLTLQLNTGNADLELHGPMMHFTYRNKETQTWHVTEYENYSEISMLII